MDGPNFSSYYKGSVVGKIYINIPGQKTFQEDLISSENIGRMSSLIRVKSILKFLLYGDIKVIRL